MAVRRKLSQDPDINILMTTTLNSAQNTVMRIMLICTKTLKDLQIYCILRRTVKTQIIFNESEENDKH
jgi:hypothetical protein